MMRKSALVSPGRKLCVGGEVTGPRIHALPSRKHSVIASHPFNPRVSAFAGAYAAGAIPCRINHGSVITRLQWDKPPSSLDYDPLLITVAEGLLERKHPYTFVARTAFEHLVGAPGALEKVVPLIGRLIPPLRAALNHPDKGVLRAGLKAIRELSTTVGPALNMYLDVLLIQESHLKLLPNLFMINKKSFDKNMENEIAATLQTLEERGGKNAYMLIKSKVAKYLGCDLHVNLHKNMKPGNPITCPFQNYYFDENSHVCRQELGTSNFSMQSFAPQPKDQI